MFKQYNGSHGCGRLKMISVVFGVEIIRSPIDVRKRLFSMYPCYSALTHVSDIFFTEVKQLKTYCDVGGLLGYFNNILYS